jgi:siroheme synthase (precorrin-2 oxidase/ferrochelatase)
MDAKVPSMLVELKIKHKNVLVVGGKADALSAVLALKDSSVTLVAQRHEMHREVLDLAEKGGFAWLARNCEERDFIGKQIVIVDSSLPQQSIIHIKHM